VLLEIIGNVIRVHRRSFSDAIIGR